MTIVEVSIIDTFEDTFMGDHKRIIRRWLITTTSGFRAEIPECPCGLRQQIGVTYHPVPHDAPDWNTRTRLVDKVYSVPKVECLCAYEAGRCTRATKADRDRRCHGWHQKRLDALVATIGGKKPKAKAITGPKYNGTEFLPVPVAWPERRDPPSTTEVTLCECAECIRTAVLLSPSK